MWLFRKKSAPVPLPPVTPPPAPAAGTYGHYRISQQGDGTPWMLGYGAMGITYRAEDINLEMPVALKVISPLIAEQPGAREFFLSEARGAASLRHRNAASVHHLGVTPEGELFFAMEFIEGETVDALLARQGRLPVPLALDFTQQTACALVAAERRRLVHRDIKPANLMLNDEGDGTILVKVIDFGLCKSLPVPRSPADGISRGQTAPAVGENQFFGTPHYASPEQIRCDADLDQRSDFYSLGATLWKMLSGRPVFHGPTARVCERHLEELPSFGDLPDDVSDPVRGLLASLLHKSPAGRPQTSAELIDRIEAAAYDHRGAEADPRKHWKVQGCVPLLGSVLAHNYHLEAIAESGRGVSAGEPTFRAEDIAGQRFVSVQLLDRDKPSMRRQEKIERLSAAPHRNLVNNHAVACCRGQPFVVREWINGFTLADVLKARQGKLAALEVQNLLAEAAHALEHAQAHGLGRVELRPGAVWVHMEGDPVHPARRDSITRSPMAEWPDFTIKFRVQENEVDDIADDDAAASAQEDVRRLAAFASELISGEGETAAFTAQSAEETTLPSFPALPVVERLLESAISRETEFGSASEFVAALAGALRAGGS